MNTNGISSEGYTFESRRLSHLDTGHLDLSAPFKGDIIRTESSNSEGFTELKLDIDQAAMIVMSRKDNAPLQVESAVGYSGSKLGRVFRKPISELVLIKSPQGNEWTATGEGFKIGDEQAFANFIHKVALFGDEKQHPDATE